MAKRKGKAKWLLFLLLIIAGVAVYFSMGDDSSKQGKPKQLYNLDKTGAGAVADYSATAKKIHQAVDGALAEARLTAGKIQETNKDVPRQKVEGSIKWHARQILVTLPDDERPENIQQLIKNAVKGSGGEVLGAPQPDEYDGQAVTRLDVGIRDALAGDPLTLITDRVYMAVRKAPAPAAKAEGAGKMAIIIDDFGYSYEPIELFANISQPLTFSVLPYKPYSNEAASRALSSGHQAMLHLPMEALAASEHSESVTILVGMSDQEIQQIAKQAIQAVPGIVGVNNHQGSRATADRRVMKNVLSVVKANGLFFVDSRTNSQSVAYDMSRQMGLRTGENYVFIDNSSDIGAIKRQLRTAAKGALQYGSVIVIGHARANTAAAIRDMLPELAASGVTLVFAADLVR